MNAIVIMAKAPTPNKVKTRMIPSLDPQTASTLYHNFLLDKIAQVKNIDAQAFIAFVPEKALAYFQSIAPSGFDLICQAGADLGERLANVSRSLFEKGFHKVLLLDSDTPNLPIENIQKGLEQLDINDVVLGPCEDGGYYLIGMRESRALLFKDIPWSTSEVTGLTMMKAISTGLSVFLLETWYDVDTIDDLMHLKRDLDSHPIRKSGFFCENSYREICRIFSDP